MHKPNDSSFDDIYFSEEVALLGEREEQDLNTERHENGEQSRHIMEEVTGWVGACAEE